MISTASSLHCIAPPFKQFTIESLNEIHNKQLITKVPGCLPHRRNECAAHSALNNWLRFDDGRDINMPSLVVNANMEHREPRISIFARLPMKRYFMLTLLDSESVETSF